MFGWPLATARNLAEEAFRCAGEADSVQLSGSISLLIAASSLAALLTVFGMARGLRHQSYSAF